MKRLVLLSWVIILLSLLSACVGSTSTPDSIDDTDVVATIVAGTLTAFPTATTEPTIMPVNTPTPTAEVWMWQNIDLYSLKIYLPTGWTLNEVNRRPEPEQYQIYGHDRADYVISNPEGTEKILLFPTCVFFGGAGDICPVDTVFMSTTNPDTISYYSGEDDIIAWFSNKSRDLLARYYDSEKDSYIYTDVAFPPLQGIVTLACKEPPITVFGENQDLRFVSVEFQYTGASSDLEQTFSKIDKIILSLGEQ